MADELSMDVTVLQLDGEIVSPRDGDIIIIRHDNPDGIIDDLQAWASSTLFVATSVLILEPGVNIEVLTENEMNDLGWYREPVLKDYQIVEEEE